MSFAETDALDRMSGRTCPPEIERRAVSQRFLSDPLFVSADWAKPSRRECNPLPCLGSLSEPENGPPVPVIVSHPRRSQHPGRGRPAHLRRWLSGVSSRTPGNARFVRPCTSCIRRVPRPVIRRVPRPVLTSTSHSSTRPPSQALHRVNSMSACILTVFQQEKTAAGPYTVSRRRGPRAVEAVSGMAIRKVGGRRPGGGRAAPSRRQDRVEGDPASASRAGPSQRSAARGSFRFPEGEAGQPDQRRDIDWLGDTRFEASVDSAATGGAVAPCAHRDIDWLDNELIETKPGTVAGARERLPRLVTLSGCDSS